MRALMANAEAGATAPNLLTYRSFTRGNDARVIPSRRARQLRMKHALDVSNVTWVDPRCAHFDQHLAGPRNRHLALDDRQHGRRPVSRETQSGHSHVNKARCQYATSPPPQLLPRCNSPDRTLAIALFNTPTIASSPNVRASSA